MDERLRWKEKFERPPAECRSVPFWAWNDKLDAAELARQAKEMKKQGMGGFFIHSREGLETDYMGREWMDCVRRTVDEAERLGLHVWLYDEDRWPSGFAGGLVQAAGGDAYRAKGLTLEVLREPELPDAAAACTALFKAVIDDRRLLRCERSRPESAGRLAENEVWLVFRVEVSERSEWFNNEAPPDQLNPDAVKCFIGTTHEAYKREVGDRFGSTVRGIFTDEPSVHDRHCRFTPGRGWVPWSDSFPGFFRERRGYDLLDVAPYLYFDGEMSSAARHDYWRTVTERFSESFSGQIGRWCEENGIAFTGHYLWENNLGTATRVCGAVMPNYRYQHVPGIDMLNEQTSEYITVKQCSSVANQYGRTFVLSETYGCTGWGFTFEGQKWMGDFQYVLGVNIRSQHLALYSLKGCRKRDYPPVFNYNTSWWKYNHVVEDYFARLSAVLTEGRPVRDVLVLHPATTAWSMVGTGPYGFPARGKDRDVSAANAYGHEFNAFLGTLLKAHYDFDLGDETIMAEEGQVRGGKLAVKLAEYRIVVIPPIRTMLASTCELLMQFLAAGGRIVAVGPPPEMIEGRPAAERLAALYGHANLALAGDAAEAATALAAALPRRVSLADAQGAEVPELLYMLREAGELRTLFVVNNDRERSRAAIVSVEGVSEAEEWDPLTGKITPVRAAAANGRLTFGAELGPAGSRLYVMRRGSQPPDAGCAGRSAARAPAEARPAAEIALATDCRFSRTMPNALTLDRCRYRFAGGEWSEEMEVWQAQRAIREALGMRQIYCNGIEQRYRWVCEPHPADGTPVEFRFTFRVKSLPASSLWLVVEAASDYGIRLNGQPAASRPEGWFLDRSFERVPLAGAVEGENELVLSCRYANRMEVEDVYLIGDFAVDADRAIVPEPETLAFGDWCLQGYPHYCGSIVYRFDVTLGAGPESGYELVIGEFSAVTVEVRVNGQPAGHIPWRAAGRLALTGLKAGTNRIELEVMGSPRNLLGPFHHAAGEPKTTGWASFRKEGDDYTPEYKLQPYGLFGRITLRRMAEE